MIYAHRYIIQLLDLVNDVCVFLLGFLVCSTVRIFNFYNRSSSSTTYSHRTGSVVVVVRTPKKLSLCGYLFLYIIQLVTLFSSSLVCAFFCVFVVFFNLVCCIFILNRLGGFAYTLVISTHVIYNVLTRVGLLEAINCLRYNHFMDFWSFSNRITKALNM